MFNWKDYYKLAQEWQSGGQGIGVRGEAYCRASVSRAYYYLFHAVKEYAEGKGFVHDPQYRGNMHQELKHFLFTDSKWSESASYGQVLKSRVDSDYKADSCINESKVKSIFNKIDSIIIKL